MYVFTEPEVAQFVNENEWWEYTQDGMLIANFTFETFLEGVSFVNDIAAVAEELWHHPDILIRYNTVTIATCTHDEDSAITQKDFDLVKRIDNLVE